MLPIVHRLSPCYPPTIHYLSTCYPPPIHIRCSEGGGLSWCPKQCLFVGSGKGSVVPKDRGGETKEIGLGDE